mgnify:FL=1
MKKNFVRSRWFFTMLLFVTTMIMPSMMWAKSITPTQPRGEGTLEKPYQIGTAAELYWFAGLVNGTLEGVKKNASANAILTTDITVNKGVLDANKDLVSESDFIEWTPVGATSDGAYTGTFDGMGYTVSGLYFNNSNSSYVGLFGYIGANGKISNVGVMDSYFQFGAYGGGVCGMNNGELQNCSNSSTVIGNNAGTGGVCGKNDKATVRDCKNTGSVRGKAPLGGVCGFNDSGIIENCFNEGTVSGTVISAEDVDGGVGGMCGINMGTIKNCYNTASVSGQYAVGGVCGFNWKVITNCFNEGTVSGEDAVGGVCGDKYNGTITNCYYLSDTAIGGIRGNDVSGSAEKKSIEQFKSGEVAWLLNGSISVPAEGSTLAWYQKLGENGDAYPVLTSTGENTVYGAYHHGEKDCFFSNTVIANQHSVAYNAEAEDEANGNHDLSYEAGEYTWTEAEDKTQVPSVAVTYTCKVCGKTETPQMTVVHDAEHDDEAATCTEDGHKYYKTSYVFNGKAIFSNAYTQTLPALGHNMSEDVTFNDSKSIYQKGCTRTDCDYHDYYATSDGSIEAKPNDDASAFTVEAFTLNDATVYNSKAEFTAQQLSYTRSFAHDKWQALYVPFETEVTEELLNDFELAAPNNLHEYELADGSTKVSLEAKLMKSGYTIKAQRPYLIRAKEAGEKTIQLTDCSLKGAAEDSYVDCSSVLRHYKFIGTLKGKTSFDTRADFVLQQGVFLGTETDTQLKPMRWYLNATDRNTDMGILPGSGNNGDGGGADGGNGSTQASRSINITIVDGDATTGIDELHVITEQTSGSKNGARLGIYDLQGRKLSQEPQNGVYIKDGKKVVK